MITLLHGEDIVLSRNYLLETKAKFSGEIIFLDGKTVEFDKLKQAVESTPLFTETRLIIIENLFGRTVKTQLKNILTYLNQFQKNSQILLWENKEVKKSSLGTISANWQVQLYNFPKLLFKFLEEIYPDNFSKNLSLLKELRKIYTAEFLFLMISRQIKYLILASDNALSGMPSWMRYKYVKQAKYFSKERLLKLYKRLLIMDINQKTGSASYEIAKELDLLLVTL